MICVYPADCTDFSGNGLGVVTPMSCTVTETLNGEWELSLVHDIDERGKWTRLSQHVTRKSPSPMPSSTAPRSSCEAEFASSMQAGAPALLPPASSFSTNSRRGGPAGRCCQADAPPFAGYGAIFPPAGQRPAVHCGQSVPAAPAALPARHSNPHIP